MSSMLYIEDQTISSTIQRQIIMLAESLSTEHIMMKIPTIEENYISIVHKNHSVLKMFQISIYRNVKLNSLRILCNEFQSI